MSGQQTAKKICSASRYTLWKCSRKAAHPATRGTTVNPDIFFQCREACNTKVAAIPDAVEHYMNEIGKITGRPHKLFDYYGAEDAERVIILMGSGAETATEAVDFLLSKGEKIGMINVHLYRPFSPKHFFQALPKSVKKIAVLDRTTEPGAMGEPLYQDICSIFKEIGSDIPIVGGRYGLSSKDTTPGQIVSVFENLKQDKPKNNFTIGIVDDVTHTSLPRVEEPKLSTEGLTSAVFWGMGSDGTVGANKNSIKIIGHATDLYCQAYFVYDSKKSGGLTQSHLRFGKNPIRSPYLVTAADFVRTRQFVRFCSTRQKLQTSRKALIPLPQRVPVSTSTSSVCRFLRMTAPAIRAVSMSAR